MSEKNGRDYIYLIWKDPLSRNNYTVGILSKNGGYEFQYSPEVRDAVDSGFKPLISMPDLDRVYTSNAMFSTFASRLPDKKRRDMDTILQKYGLPEYNEYQLLKLSGARLPIDTLEFIDPIFPDDQNVSRQFYVAGARHYLSCEGKTCPHGAALQPDDPATLCPEPDNPHDPNALKVLSSTGEHLGYVPRYYTEDICKRLKAGAHYTCRVLENNCRTNCAECIKIQLTIEA